MNSRGISHIEVILSFLIFIGFVIFALYFFSPFENSRLVESSLSYALSEVIKNTSIEVDSYSIKLDKETRKNIGKIIEVEIKGVNDNKNVRVESYIGEVVPSRRETGNKDIVRIKLDDKLYGFNGDDGFAIIKFSEDISAYKSPGELDGPILIPEDGKRLYEAGASNKIELISEKRINDLKVIYEKSTEDYRKIKKKFNLPNGVNFGFSLIFDDGKKIETNEDIPNGIKVDANSKRMELLEKNSEENKNDRIVLGDLTVKIW